MQTSLVLRSRMRRTIVSGLAMAVLAVGMSAVPPALAQEPGPAETVAITAGAGLDWGVKESWRTYIGAQGVTYLDGASRNADGTVHFPLEEGSYDPTNRTTDLQFGGEVRFYAHEGLLDYRLADPRVVIDEEGSVLRGRVTSRELGGDMAMIDHGIIDLVSLDVVAVEPVVAGGTTTWNAIPAYLTAAGTPSFGHNYAPGILFDPVTVSYEGAGGKPRIESWTDPGTALYEAQTGPDDITPLGWLPDGNMIGFRAAEVVVIDPDDLSEVVAAPRQAQNSTFAAPILDGLGTMITFGSGTFVEHSWDGTSITSSQGSIASVRAAAWDPVGDRMIVARHTAGTPQSTVSVRHRGAEGWTERTLGGHAGRTIRNIVVTSDGVILGVGSGAPVLLQVDGPDLIATEMDGIGSYTHGRPVGGGDVWLAETGGSGRAVLVSVAGDGTWTAEDPVALGPVSAPHVLLTAQDIPMTTDLVTKTLYINTAAGDTKVVAEDRVVAAITGTGAILAGANDILYRRSAAGLERWRRVGVSPTVTASPDDVTEVVASPAATASATFRAAAHGSPTPQVQWQVRPPGATTFRDLDGATSTTLTVEVAGTSSGVAYRAVFSNPAGALATDPATLVLHHPPAILAAPTSVAVAEGEAAQFLVMPTGSPYPSIIWQRRVQGQWVDLSPSDPAYAIDGGFLTILGVATEDSGAQFRVRLVNSVDVVTSAVVFLIVGGGAGAGEQHLVVEVPDAGPGELLWSVAGSGPVALGPPTDEGDHWSFAGEIHPIEIIDTRAEGPAWSVAGRVGDFTGGLPGSHLGWVPEIVSSGAGAVAGPPVVAGFPTGPGLSQPSILASAPAGHQRGGAVVGAGLDLRLPIDTDPGSYTAVLTITALS